MRRGGTGDAFPLCRRANGPKVAVCPLRAVRPPNVRRIRCRSGRPTVPTVATVPTEEISMESRTLGSLTVSALGLGCMGMSEFYGHGEENESIATIQAFLDAGGSLLDTADMYGPFTNEMLVGRAIAGRRDDVVLATKFGNERRPDGSWVGINGSPDYVRAACDASLQRLGVDHIDLYYQHRVDKTVPIEETVGAMA